MGNTEKIFAKNPASQRAAELDSVRAGIKANIATELRNGPWGTHFSPLSPHRGGVSFEASFSLVIPEGLSLKEDIEQTLSPYRGNAIAIEVGGVGTPFGEFTPGFFKRSLGTNLTDYRSFLDFDPTEEDKKKKS